MKSLAGDEVHAPKRPAGATTPARKLVNSRSFEIR
jgi:hypothetical protein